MNGWADKLLASPRYLVASLGQGVAWGRVAWAGWPRVITHPGLPQIHTCRTTASGSSSQGFATCGDVPARTRVGKVPGASPFSLSVSITVTQQQMSGIHGGSCRRVHDLTPRFPPPGPLGSSSPASSVLSRRYDFLPPLSPHFVAFAWRYHGNTRVSLPRPPSVAASGLGLVTRYPRPGLLPWRRQDLPRSEGNPSVPLPCSSTPAGLACQAITTRQRGPRSRARRRLPQYRFRGSITRL